MSRDELIQAIEQMSVLELSELVKALEDKFGVSASAAPMMMAAMPGAAAPAAAAEEEAYYEEPAPASAPAQSGDACIDACREGKKGLSTKWA